MVTEWSGVWPPPGLHKTLSQKQNKTKPSWNKTKGKNVWHRIFLESWSSGRKSGTEPQGSQWWWPTSPWGPLVVWNLTELWPSWEDTFPKTPGKGGEVASVWRAEVHFWGLEEGETKAGQPRVWTDFCPHGLFYSWDDLGVCVWGVCSLLPLALGLEEGEDGRYRRLGERCASVPAVDVCTYSGLNMKCRPHTLTCLYTWSQQVALFDVVDPLGGEAAGGHESPVATDLPVTAWLWLWPKSVLSLCILAAIEMSPSMWPKTSSHNKARAVATMSP